uniref:Uncharacterized protein n=1 Tax=Romanomermis culicivorax TaxID=13658 RepID=A0A915KCV4_ROMCU
MLACEKRYLGVCQELLSQWGEEQTKLRRKDSGDTVLHVTIKAKNLEILKLVIDHGAVIDAQNDSGKTALYLAVETNFIEAVNLLYSVNADPNIVDKNHKSPLHIAAEMGHTTMIETLADKFKAPLSSRTQVTLPWC